MQPAWPFILDKLILEIVLLGHVWDELLQREGKKQLISVLWFFVPLQEKEKPIARDRLQSKIQNIRK